MSDYDDPDLFEDDRGAPARAPADGRILWGRVAVLAVVLILAFAVGRWSAPGDDTDRIAELEAENEALEEDIEQLEAEIDALEAGGTEDAPADDEDGGDEAEDGADDGDEATAAANDGEDGDGGNDSSEEADDSEDQEGSDESDDVTSGVSQHDVREGDHLYGLAENYYGDGERWRDIAEANDLTSEDVLRPGMTLEIPDAEGP
ncbi:LysM peptidoglycan-binding domain-containing protein [Egibacter rhizosphaerae]|uniref:LysM peptidoglycan-binding domain-containing protein n=1 Tax=Egibacter rhizosphaerae TaxID=1670831 RepID=A0A411YJM7_9ACTN|nr:LysM peptidoglycan-binding domain-containing protein [Egibacter rhizosphaerae]QBI21356.1 LysM peptidoglycan-binding domain-containing protein [Egibacter rhizosphaerae]